MRFLLIVLLSFFTVSVFAQTIDTFSVSGTVRDSASNDPLAYCSVSLKKSNTVILETITDLDGNYIIKRLKPGKYTLTFFYTGYGKLDMGIKIADKDYKNLNIIMSVGRDNFLKVIKGDFECQAYNKKTAHYDIENHEVLLVLHPCIGCTPNTSADSIFEKEYNITYQDPGCIDSKCYSIYNKVVFRYLDKKFGRKWRKEARKNVVGL